MRLKNIIIACIIICKCTLTFGQKYDVEQLLQQDISNVFKFEYGRLNGVLGADYSRIELYLKHIEKMDNRTYLINGATRTRAKIVSAFSGAIVIDSIDCSEQYNDEVNDIDGYICGHYKFIERGDASYSGIFSGNFRQAFSINNGKINPAYSLGLNDVIVVTYIGEWKNTNITKQCNWTDGSKIPGTPNDFSAENAINELMVNTPYLKRGWDVLYNAVLGSGISEEEREKARKIEQAEWWKEVE